MHFLRPFYVSFISSSAAPSLTFASTSAPRITSSFLLLFAVYLIAAISIRLLIRTALTSLHKYHRFHTLNESIGEHFESLTSIYKMFSLFELVQIMLEVNAFSI